MKTALIAAVLLSLVALIAGCSTTEGRISKHQSTFQTLSPEDQERIRKGEVAVGFTEEMVLMALGEPDRRYSRTTERGTVNIWAYRSKAPAISFGFGVGGGSGGTGMGAGVGVSTGDRSDDRLRLIFEANRVTAIEREGK